ncbi:MULTISPECIES: hypothetical protein [Methylocystis]|uniref:hypothetical protein n=1 Tax=Methylocystis TaxID=133 RepID=UPI0024BBA77C|nr:MULTISPECIES: hypothetical protein [Methylocystis]MDJ0449556.1 hypothetical protein [Methylocystis sp. JR02]
MIRPQISNAIILSILFASLAAGATLMLMEVPAIHRAESGKPKAQGSASPARDAGLTVARQ